MVDVLIVGAGPAGLNLALSLHHFGIPFRIIDKKNGPTKTSNAIGVNSRSLEVWNHLGIANEAIKRGLPVKFFSVNNEKGIALNHVEFKHIKSAYQFMFSLPQSKSEELMIENVINQGNNIEWGSEFVSLIDNKEHITVKCLTQSGEETIQAKWVIGCDGYSGKVRDSVGVARVCQDRTDHFFIADADVEGGLPTGKFNLYFNDKGAIVALPLPHDKMRVLLEVSHDPKYKDIKNCQPEVFKEILASRNKNIKLGQIDWISGFHIHECLANSYRRGRVFIAGDAAHSHSPFSGQGMNTGMQDGWNLAWKLSQVIKGQAQEQLLDTYEIERIAVAKNVLKESAKLTSLSASSNFFIKILRNFLISHVFKLDFMASKMVNGISQIDICYKNSPLVNYRQVKKVGILRYTNLPSKWMVLSKEEPQLNLPDFVTITTVNDNDSLGGYKYCLVRPDGYIAMYANNVEEIKNYFTKNGFLN